jgi:hypothetical protein
MIFPEMALVRQKLHAGMLQDIPAAVDNAVQCLQIASVAKGGECVAVAVGSRGISHMPLVVSECVKFLKDLGLRPFVVPAMGSHGGNTPEGELSVLARLGINESFVSVPVLAAEDVVEIGKEISGIGMDSNVTGRHRDIVGDFCTAPYVKRIFLPEKAAIPMYFETDRECIEACLNTIGMVKPEAAQIIRIKNTATLETLWVSRTLEGEVRSNPDLQVLGPWEPMAFDDSGNLSYCGF